MAPAIERAGYGGRYADVDRPRSPGGPARAVPVRYTTAREVLAVAITREQLHRALDSLPAASLPDLAEYIDWLRQREEPLSPDELAEVQAATSGYGVENSCSSIPCGRTDVAMALEVVFDREAARYFERLDRTTQE